MMISQIIPISKKTIPKKAILGLAIASVLARDTGFSGLWPGLKVFSS
jgi:hypothetical protein